MSQRLCPALLGTFLAACLLGSSALADEWMYVPGDVKFWKESQELLEKKNYATALKKGLSEKGAEAQLVVAEAFLGLDMTIPAYEAWLTIVRENPNTSAANLALIRLSQFHASRRYPEDELHRLMNEGRQRDAQGEGAVMLGYFHGLDNMKKGFTEWIDQDLKKVDANSYWGRRLKFFGALEQVRANKPGEALNKLTALSTDSQIEAHLKMDVDWQIARLNLDLGNYDEAEKIYSSFLFSGRDFGRALLERAWIRYFKKDYSKALGILYSLRAPYFNASRTPEQYLLSMLIYRDLCHYKSIASVASEFERVFEPTFKKMKTEKMREIPEILSMTLVRSDVLPSADLVYLARQQREKIKGPAFSGLQKQIGKYIAVLNAKEAELRSRLEFKLKDKLEEQANKLLEARDQVKLLDYVAGLEQLRWEKSVKRQYSSEKEDPLKFENLYWNFKKEYWWDETSKFQVLVKSRCGGAAL